MIEIFAHRAIINSNENSLKGIEFYAKNGINVELDIRKNTSFYLSHDKTGYGESFTEACNIISNSNIEVALHVKELDITSELKKLIEEYSLEKKIFFFMDDISYTKFSEKFSEKFRLAKYVNKKMDMNGKILWCDESKEKWFEKDKISKMHKEGKKLIVMSPELLKNTDMNKIKMSWKDFINLGFDAICTDFPMELKKWLKTEEEKL